MIKPYFRDGNLLGEVFAAGDVQFFFGSAHLRREHLASEFPHFKFSFLKQVHGSDVVPATAGVIHEADGHFSDDRAIALAIQTADCLPVLMANDDRICALHAGWRGVAKNIVRSAGTVFTGPPKVALIGPHIQFSSFEVGRDVAAALIGSAPKGTPTEELIGQHQDPTKCYFNLAGLITHQLKSAFPNIQILKSSANTITDHNYHSYRRNGPNAGRQFSFVVKKP